MNKLQKAAKTSLKTCMGLKKSETCLIVTDEGKKVIATVFFNEAMKLCKEAVFMEMKSRKVNGQPPPASVAEAMKSADVALLITTKSISHTNARKEASKSGTRIASMPGITKAMAERAIDIDYKKMLAAAKKYKRILDRGELLHLETPLGTNLNMSIKGQTFKIDSGICTTPGRFSNLPAGEVCYSPVEGTTNGIYYVDVCMGTGLLKSPLRITVKNGYAVKIEGRDSAKIKKMFKGLGKKAFNIAEIAIGLNPKAKLTGIVLEDEKKLGTAHIAIGNNKSFGGTHDVPIHIDGVFTKPTISVDGRHIVKNGKAF